MSTIGENIVALRKKRNLTQEAMADLIGVSAQSVSKWENNINMPDISLLPVLADFFACRIDDLFGRAGAEKGGDPRQALDNCCEAVLQEVGACAYDPEPGETFRQCMAEYRNKLKENDDHRTAVMCPHGMVYYREKLGALLLKRPEAGWHSLLEKEELGAVFTLLGDRDFRTALAEICRSCMIHFTLSSLCRRCGIQDEALLGEKLKESGLFWTETVDVDGRQITIYDLAETRKLTMLFAVLSCAAEFREFKDSWTCFFGCGTEELLRRGREIG